MNNRQVAALFVEQRILDQSQVDDLLEEAKSTGNEIDQLLIDYGFVDEQGFYQTIANAFATELIDLSEEEIAPEVLQLIPAGLARLHRALPVSINAETLNIALVDPLDLRVAEDLRFALGKDIHLVIASAKQIEERIDRYYGPDSSTMNDILDQLETKEPCEPGEEDENTSVLTAEANATPIIRFVDLILFQAIQDRASDIHFEPFENEFKIRYRVDGVLHELSPPPRHLALFIISRLKVMANLNIAERRLPQDGRIQKKIAGQTVDLRVSTLPTHFGESVVLRVLDRSILNLDLESLGLPDPMHDQIIEIIHRPNGIFIVTGPTGSGKTTTLYSCLRKINRIDSKWLSAEEPIEYDLEGVIQLSVNETIGLTFARALRSFLRQDPDGIMVGETRDLETAQISVQASLTGHLVFTTLHTNDAPSAIVRLIDMGVEPFLIASSLEAVLGQRLLRTICPQCRTPFEPSEPILTQLGLAPQDVADHQFYYGRGCNLCNQTGYKGRKGIYELLRITEPLRDLISERAPAGRLKAKAVELGMVTLRQSGLRSVFAGDTTIHEVLKYTSA